eukprot:scaffold11368_cov19-Tisochrysis_lutea.AAC.1
MERGWDAGLPQAVCKMVLGPSSHFVHACCNGSLSSLQAQLGHYACITSVPIPPCRLQHGKKKATKQQHIHHSSNGSHSALLQATAWQEEADQAAAA